MSYAWDDMTDKEHAAALELMGGKRNANAVQAVIQQFQIAEESLETAQNSIGSAMKENDKYMNSIQGKLTKFQATFEVLSNDLLDSGAVKGVVDLGTGALGAVDGFIKLAGAIPAVTTALSALLSMSNVDTSGSILNLFNLFDTKKIGGKTELTIGGMPKDSFIKSVNEIKNVIESLQSADGQSTTGTFGILGSLLMGNNQKGYDIVKNLKTDVQALQEVLKSASTGKSITDILPDIKSTHDVSNFFMEFATSIDTAGMSLDEMNNVYIPQFINQTTGVSVGVRALDGVLKSLGRTALSVGAQMITSFAIGAAINLAIQGVMLLGDAINDLMHPDEKLDESILSLSDSASNYNTELKSLQTELDGTNKKIKELSLSNVGEFIDQQEIDKLKTASIELENQIKLKKILQEENATELNNTVSERANVKSSVTLYSVKETTSSAYDYNNIMSGGGANSANFDSNAKPKTEFNLSANGQFGTDIENLYALMEAYDENKQKLAELENQYSQGIITDSEYTSGKKAITTALEENSAQATETISKIQEMNNSLDENGAGYEEQSAAFNSAISKYVEWNEKSVQGLTDMQRAYQGYNDAIASGDESAKKLQEAVSGGAVLEGSEAYAYATELAQKYNVTVDDLITSLTQMSAETINAFDSANARVSTVTESAESLVASIGLVNDALSTQSASAGVSQEAYDSLIEADSDYAAALEYSYGYMQLNQEMAGKITKAKVEEAKANIEVSYSQNQMLYAQNKADMAVLDKELENNLDLTDEQRENLESARDALEEQNKTIRENCKNLQMQYSALMQVSSAYSEWQNAKNTEDSDAMLNDLSNAMKDIEDGLKTQRIGTDDFKSAVNLLIPEDIPEDEINDYKKRILDKLLQYDDDGNIKAAGLNNFIKQLLNAGIAEANEDGYISLAMGTTLSEAAEAANVTEDVAQALFGGLEAYGWEIDWQSLLGNEIDNLRMQLDDLYGQLENLDPDTDAWDEVNDKIKETEERLSEIYSSKEGGIDSVASDIQSVVDSANGELTDEQKAILNGGGRVQVALDLSEAKQDLASLQEELSSKSQLTLVDTQNLLDAQDKVTELTQKKEQLGEPTSIEIKAYLDSGTEAETEQKIQKLADAGIVDLDASAAMTNLDTASKQVQDIKNDAGNVVLSIDTKSAQSNIQSVKDAIDNIPTSKTLTLNIKQKGSVVGFSSGLFSGSKTSKSSGSGGPGGAYGGVFEGGKTLVGELGNEIVVDPNAREWRTVGDNGAEFVNLPKDAIVFDHEKTKRLLGTGSAGGRGRSLARGTAMPSGSKVSGGGFLIGQDPTVKNTYTGTTSAIKNNTSAVEANIKALEAQKEALEKQKEAYEDESNALKIYGQAAINEIDKRIDAINKEKEAQQKSYQNQIKQLQEYQKQQDKMYEKQIDALEDKKKALQKANDEEDRAIKLQELQDELARAQSQRTVRIYNENEGFVWSADQEAVDEAQGNLDDQQREWENEDAINAIDEEIDRINDLKDAFDESIENQIDGLESRQEAMEEAFEAEIENLEAVKEQWNDALSLIGTSWEDYQLQLAAAAEFNGMSLEQMAAGVGAYKDDVIANMQAIGETSAEIDKVTEAINALESAAGGGGGAGGGSGEIEGSGLEETGDFSGGGIANLASQLQEAGGVSAETAEKLEELRNKIIEIGDANLSLQENETALQESLANGNMPLSERTEKMAQLDQVQGQMAENQAMLSDLSAQYVETLGNEVTATDEARQIASDALTELAQKYGVSYDEIFNKLNEYIQKLSESGTGTSEQFTSMSTTIQMFSTSVSTSLSAAGGQFDALVSKAQSMAAGIQSACNKAISALNQLKAAQNSSSNVKHATGILNSPTTHMAITDEQGPEIKIRPMSGNYSLIERGTSVIPAGPSENLWKFGLNPDAFIARHINQRAVPKIEISEPVSGGVSIGDVSIEMYGVNDVESFGSVLAQKAPAIIAQTFSRRK